MITAKHINSSTKKFVDADEKTNGNNADSQERIRQLTSNENMMDYCQFTMQSLMECSEIVGGLKRQLHYKINMSRNYKWRSVLYISIVLFTPLISAKSYVNKNVEPQDALTISSNRAQSSALVEAKIVIIKNYLTKSCIHQKR